jgi:antitoxin component of MazEF toxin-antitoxin module
MAGPDWPLTSGKVITIVITKVRRIGNSLGVVLPKEAVQAMKVKEGATLYITAAPECALRLTPEHPGFGRL